MEGENIPEFQQIANQFCVWYYTMQNSENKEALAGVYSDQSLFTLQEKQIVGRNSIMEKLTNDLGQTEKKPAHYIAQPSFDSQGEQTILISVIGDLKVTPEEDNVIPFFEIFLLQNIDGNFLVKNQIFSTHSL